jgi:hypothetical protein
MALRRGPRRIHGGFEARESGKVVVNGGAGHGVFLQVG